MTQGNFITAIPTASFTHPAAVAARKLAQERQAHSAFELAQKQELIDEIAEENQLRFIDITPCDRRITPGMTIAFTGDSVLQVSTAVRNPADKYSKLEGRLTAARAFNNGNWIYLRKPKGMKTAAFIRHVFSF